MKEVFRHSNAGFVNLRQSVLESAGIPTFVRNLNTQQALVGDPLTALFPIPEFWPTLCVVDDNDYARAMEVLRDARHPEASSLPEWHCPQCHEAIPGHFEVCWKCGHVADQ